MCGIVGYIGKAQAVESLLDALSRLEYRGYDSAGVAAPNSNGIEVRKRAGKLKALADAIRHKPIKGRLGIGHTRWATHGEPSERNAHPHADCKGKLAVVHNGIIENYSQLKDRLLAKGHSFRSQTDTDVIAHLVEELAKKHPIEEAFRLALKELKGSYAICLISEDAPNRLFGARNGSPLVVGVGHGESFFASDVPAVLGRTKRVVYLNDNEVVELSANGPRLLTLDGRVIRRQPTTITWDLAAARKGGYPHYMLKEIHEQPSAIEQTLFNRLDPVKGRVTFDRRTRVFLDKLSPQEQFVILACGTAYHAGLVGEYMLEELTGIPVDVDLASEFRYRGAKLSKDTTVLALTQSREPARPLARNRGRAHALTPF